MGTFLGSCEGSHRPAKSALQLFHARQGYVDTVSWKSSLSSCFSINRWVVWAIEINVYFQPFAVLGRLLETDACSFLPCPWPCSAAHPGPSSLALLRKGCSIYKQTFSYVQFTTLVDFSTFIMFNTIGTRKLYLSNEKYWFCSRVTVMNLKVAKKVCRIAEKKFTWWVKTFTEQLDRKEWTLQLKSEQLQKHWCFGYIKEQVVKFSDKVETAEQSQPQIIAARCAQHTTCQEMDRVSQRTDKWVF